MLMPPCPSSDSRRYPANSSPIRGTQLTFLVLTARAARRHSARRQAAPRGHRASRQSPPPVANLGQVVTVARDELAVLDQFVLHLLLDVGAARPELRQTVDHVVDEMEAVEV